MYAKINTDGTLSSANKQHEGYIPLAKFERSDVKTGVFNQKGQDGFWYAEFYQTTPDVNGKYLKDDVKIEDAQNILLEIKANEDRDKLMLNGDVYTLNGSEYIISFTKADGDGVVQVKNAFDLGLPSTTIHFENGTKLPITALEFTDFALWFVGKRDAFFG